MSLRGFKYLHKRRILTLTVILTLTSMIFSITAFSFLSFYSGFSNYVGEETDVAAIYGTTGSTPLTGIVPIYFVDQISAVNGVLASSPEVIAPCVIKDQSVFVRGVFPQEISKINNIALIEGDPLELSDLDSTIIGKSLSERLNLKVNDSILAFGVITGKYATLRVQGIFESGSTIDDEALVPLYCGQWLRGYNYNQASLIRVKMDLNQVNINTLYQVIAKEISEPASPQPNATKTETQRQLEALIPFSRINFNLDDIGIQESQSFLKNYLNQYGVSKDTLLVISMVVFAFASGTAAGTLTLFMNQHKHEIGVLRSIGASAKKVKTDMLIKTLPWSIIASILGTALGAVVIFVFQKVGYLQVLSHSVVFQLDPLIVAANFALLLAIVFIGIARSKVTS